MMATRKHHSEKPAADGARYTWPFHVRHYELGPSGMVRPEVYLNWMQEAGIMASANAGFPLERYELMGAFWWVHRFRIEWLASIGYRDSLEATTWISDFRRIRALREYEVRRSEDQRLVCCAQADWAFVNTTTGRPIRVPEEMMESFPPSGLEAVSSLPWDWDVSHTGDHFFTTRRVVQFHELDAMEHVNHAIYLVWLLDNLEESIQAAIAGECPGLSPERFDVEYLYSAQNGDQLLIACRLADWNCAKGRWSHQISLQDGTEVIRAHSVCRLESSSAGSDVEKIFHALAGLTQ